MKLKSIKILPPEISEYKLKKTQKTICVFDTETDPFSKEVRNDGLKPFTCGFYDGVDYVDFVGDECIQQFVSYLSTRREDNLLIYAHNLGGFDVHFLHDYFDNDCNPIIINGRICKINICRQEWRDSYKILPVPLSSVQKDDFDYTKMSRDVRHKHMDEIRLYQRHDCEYLHSALVEFHEMFGDRITIGNTAISMFNSFHGFNRLSKSQDTTVREYFYGGRTQCFETGILDDDWKVYDVNSMYPYAMSAYKHPIDNIIHSGRKITDETAFVHVLGWNEGALPRRGKDGELDFTGGYGEYKCTIHEYKTATELGLFKTRKIIRTLDFALWADFSEYVNHFYQKRLEAKASGDKLRDLFYKLLLNNAYGKFAQDGKNYKDYIFLKNDQLPKGYLRDDEHPNGWLPKYINDYGTIWERPTDRPTNYFNVATGASITGAARASLLRGISAADRPVYCDTDSIICRSLESTLDPRQLGAWKLEAEGTSIAIAGKKMYALRNGEGVIKKASKGVGLTDDEIFRLAAGETIMYVADKPTFGLDGSVTYIDREVKATG